MRDERIMKAHELLSKIENLRFNIVCIANITNPHITDSYERKMIDELIEVENLIQKALEHSHSSVSAPQNAELQV